MNNNISFNLYQDNSLENNTFSHLSYPIKLNTSFNKINLSKETNIYICVFSIIQNSSIQSILKPFLKFFLYKFPNNSSKFKDYLVFPFVKSKSNPLDKANKLFHSIFNTNFKPKGFIQNNNGIYMFYQFDETYKLLNIKRNDNYWWALIDEICNKKLIVNFPIHSSVYSLFFNNPSIIYLLNKNKPVEIPMTGFYGDHITMIPYVSSLGTKANTKKFFGPYYYLGDYNYSIKNSSWTTHYGTRKHFDINLTNKDGKYQQGGIIRFAIFLGNTRIILYRETDDFYWYFKYMDSIKNKSKKNIKNFQNTQKKNKGRWTNKYDSCIISPLKWKYSSGYWNLNTEYILKSFEQHIPLSIHSVDMKTIPPIFNPIFKHYFIE